MDFQSMSAVVFLAVMLFVVFLHRKKIDIQKILFPLIYLGMYRTRFGIRWMEKVAKRFNKLLRFTGIFGIYAGFLGMVYICVVLIYNVYMIFIKPEALPGVGLVLPFQVKGVFYVPFFYWIISLFVIIIVHEFSHGVLAKAWGMKIKSSGLAFLALIIPIIPAAFVEPDEKELAKRKGKEQLSVYAAGPFANIIFGILVYAILILVLFPFAAGINEANGVVITDFDKNSAAKINGLSVGERIIGIGNASIINISDLGRELKRLKPNNSVLVRTDKGEYDVVLGSHPRNGSIPYMGIFLEQGTEIKEKYSGYSKFNDLLIWLSGNPLQFGFYSRVGLIGWIILLSIGIGLFNLVPVGPLDGGRMLIVALKQFFNKKLADKIWHYTGSIFLLLILINIFFAFLR